MSDQNCKSISGLCKEHFYDLLTKLTSLKNSKNRTVAAALVIFLVKMKTNMSHDNISAFFSMKNASLHREKNIVKYRQLVFYVWGKLIYSYYHKHEVESNKL